MLGPSKHLAPFAAALTLLAPATAWACGCSGMSRGADVALVSCWLVATWVLFCVAVRDFTGHLGIDGQLGFKRHAQIALSVFGVATFGFIGAMEVAGEPLYGHSLIIIAILVVAPAILITGSAVCALVHGVGSLMKLLPVNTPSRERLWQISYVGFLLINGVWVTLIVLS